MLKPNTTRNAYLLYRLLQLRYASREQIKRHIFGDLDPDSQDTQATNHLGRNSDNIQKGYIEHIKDSIPPLYYVTKEGREILLACLDNRPKTKNGYADAFNQIDREDIERNPNPGAGKQKSNTHRRLVADTLIHFFKQENYRTASDTELKIEGLANIKPDQTLIKNTSMGFIELENKGELKDIQEKMRRYIRYYFSGDFQKQFPQFKYARVFIVHNQKNKLEELIEYLLSLTYEDVHFKKPIHPSNDHIGRNLFRFSGLDFKWIKASDWSKHKHNKEPLTFREAWG